MAAEIFVNTGPGLSKPLPEPVLTKSTVRSSGTHLSNFIGYASGYHSLILVSKLLIEDYSRISQGHWVNEHPRGQWVK